MIVLDVLDVSITFQTWKKY